MLRTDQPTLNSSVAQQSMEEGRNLPGGKEYDLTLILRMRLKIALHNYNVVRQRVSAAEPRVFYRTRSFVYRTEDRHLILVSIGIFFR